MTRRPKTEEYKNPLFILLHEGNGWDDEPLILGVTTEQEEALALMQQVVEEKALGYYSGYNFKELRVIRGTQRCEWCAIYLDHNDEEVDCWFKICKIEANELLKPSDLQF